MYAASTAYFIRLGARWTRGLLSAASGSTKYPGLSIIWRYWFDLGRYSGYIDNDGNHCWHYKDGKWVDEAIDPSPELVHDFGTLDAVRYVLGPLSPRANKQLALTAIEDRKHVHLSNLEHAIWHNRYGVTWAYRIMTVAGGMLGKEVADELWRLYWEANDELECRDVSMCLGNYMFNTLNEAARYVLELLRRQTTVEIAREAFDICRDASVGDGKDAASVAWANIVLEAAADVLEMGEGGMKEYLQEQFEAGTIGAGGERMELAGDANTEDEAQARRNGAKLAKKHNRLRPKVPYTMKRH